MRESLEFVLDAPRPALPLSSPVLSFDMSTEGASVRVSNLRRGIMALEEERAGWLNRERLEG